MGMIHLQLKLTDGTHITVELEKSRPTIADVRAALITEHHYGRSTQIMFGSSILKDERLIDEFPFGSLLVVGQKVSAASAPHSVSPQRSGNVKHTTHHSQRHAEGAAPPLQAQPTRSPPREAGASNETPPPQSEGPIILFAVIPALGKRLVLELSSHANLADLLTNAIAKEPSLLGAKVVFKGKALNVLDKKHLFEHHIHHDDTIYLATGTFTNSNHLLLFQIHEEYSQIKQKVDTRPCSDADKKGFYEQLMRALFKTDDLKDLEEEWRAKRKQLVRDITDLQDKLKVA